jgi:hypothetical protein
MADKLNIIIGAAQFWIGTATAVKPAYVLATSYNTSLNAAAGWTNVGYTQEGVEVQYSPEYGNVQVDQLLDDAKLFKSGQTLMINTTFAEATLENLLVVWGQATTSLTSSGTGDNAVKDLVMVGGDLGTAPIERQIIAVGNATEKSGAGYYNERTYHATRALSIEQSSMALRRSEATVLPVSFRLLPNDAGSGNPYGVIHDRVRTTAWA